MGYGIIEISFPLLRDGLPFPDDTRFITVQPGQWGLTFKLIVSHPDIKNSGPTPIECLPVFKRQPEVILETWGEMVAVGV